MGIIIIVGSYYIRYINRVLRALYNKTNTELTNAHKTEKYTETGLCCKITVIT